MKNKMLSLAIMLILTSNLYSEETLKPKPVPAYKLPETSPMDKLITFKKMQKKQKNDWLDYAASNEASKIKLAKKHYGETVDLAIQNLVDLKNKKDFSKENADALLDDHLSKAITLHKKQAEEWKDFCTKQYQKSKDIGEIHAKELSQFVEKNMP